MPAAQQIKPQEDTHLQVLRLLEHNPHMSQRELAQALGLSLGKTNKGLYGEGLRAAVAFGLKSW